MDKAILFRRHGDVNFHPITKEEFDKCKYQTKKHDGSYIVARGEATNSTHVIAVNNIKDLIIKEDGEDRFIAVLSKATITHTTDHETIEVPAQTYYKQVQEREIDWFADGVTRQVTD